ncbi:MAG: PqqD family protein [Erysipelotrichaceae bacterium]|nr:PqqD family protein [Erysipelotrichaceae bacterium]
MRFLYKYKTKEYLGEYILIPTDENIFDDKALLSLNYFGYYIISLMNQDITEEEILKKITEHFGSDEETINAYESLRDTLIKKQLIK